MDFYFTIDTPGCAEFKDRGSRFLAYSYPFRNAEEFKKHLQVLKKEHSKAVHYCFGYRLGFDGNNFRSGDDGEPAGTAGKQILGQIDSKNLTNTLIIVVRYFGGTLLGVPGLKNAYKTSASLVLQCTPIAQRADEENYVLEFDYSSMNDVMRILKEYYCGVYKNETQLFCKIEAGIPRYKKSEVLNALTNLRNVEVLH